MKISQKAAHSLDNLTTFLTVNASFQEDNAISQHDTGYAFDLLTDVIWSVGSLGYVEVSWKVDNEYEVYYTLSGNGTAAVPADRPHGSDGLIHLRFVNFKNNDAAMVCFKGELIS